MFTAAMVCVYLCYMQNGKFIAGGSDLGDALTQQLTFFRYWGEYIRDFFSSVAEGHPELPLWTWSVTGGADILGTFAHYDITNPIMLLAGFFDGNTAEQGWVFLILLRTYLAGAAFSAFCLYHKKSRVAILAGSLVYITSFYVSVLCTEQEMYFNMAIYLPLMLLAIDKGMRERTYGLLIATVFLAIISSYYFFYMITILSAVYAVFRGWHNAPRGRKAPQTFLFLARLALPFLAGVALSAVVFLPQLHAFLNNARTVTPELSVFYNPEFYWRYVMRFTAQGSRFDSQAPGIGAGAMALLAVIYLFSQRRRYGQEKFFIILFTVFSLFPLFGWMMNGFSYATNNRWHLGFVLALSWAVVQTLPDPAARDENSKRHYRLCRSLYHSHLLLLHSLSGGSAQPARLCNAAHGQPVVRACDSMAQLFYITTRQRPQQPWQKSCCQCLVHCLYLRMCRRRKQRRERYRQAKHPPIFLQCRRDAIPANGRLRTRYG